MSFPIKKPRKPRERPDPFEVALLELEKSGETMEPDPEEYERDAIEEATMRKIPR